MKTKITPENILLLLKSASVQLPDKAFKSLILKAGDMNIASSIYEKWLTQNSSCAEIWIQYIQHLRQNGQEGLIV